MFFIKNNQISDPPWTVYDKEQGTIVDQWGRLVAVVPCNPPKITASSTLQIGTPINTVPKVESMDPQFYENNLAVITAAPELLAALKEAAFHLDQAGIPLNQSFYDLINRASGNHAVLAPVNKPVDKQK